MLCSLSLIFANERSQILLVTVGTRQASTNLTNMLINLMILVAPITLAIVYPEVGSMAAKMGAIGGYIVIYLLPTVTYMYQSYMGIKQPRLIAEIREEPIEAEDVAERDEDDEFQDMQHEKLIISRKRCSELDEKKRLRKFLLMVVPAALAITVYGGVTVYYNLSKHS